MHRNLIQIIILFIFSLFLCIIAITYIENTYLKNNCDKLIYPKNLEILKSQINNVLKCYNYNKSLIYVIHMICFVFLQTWCIPGTIIFNLFGGAVFGIKLGFILCLIVRLLYITYETFTILK